MDMLRKAIGSLRRVLYDSIGLTVSLVSQGVKKRLIVAEHRSGEGGKAGVPPQYHDG